VQSSTPPVRDFHPLGLLGRGHSGLINLKVLRNGKGMSKNRMPPNGFHQTKRHAVIAETCDGQGGELALPCQPAPGPAMIEPLLWSVEQTASALCLSVSSVKRMSAAGEIPGVVKLGRRRLFDRRRLERWIADGCPVPRRRGY
jgi:hypothetical protein